MNDYIGRKWVNKTIRISTKLVIMMLVIVTIMPLSASASPYPIEEDSPVGWTPYGGNWTVEDSVYSVSYDDGYPSEKRLINFGSEYTDFSIEADIAFSVNGGNAGFIVRVSDPLTDEDFYGTDKQNAYYIGIESNGSQVFLGKTKITSYEQPASAVSTPSSDHTYHLKVVLSGNHIQVYVDNILIINYTDTDNSFTTGMVGLRSFYTDASYSNLVISTIPVTTISQSTNEISKFVTVNLQTSNSESSTTYYQINNGSTATGSSFELQTSGIHFITYWSVSEAGAIEDKKHKVIKVDLNPSDHVGSVNISDIVILLIQNEMNTFSTDDIQLMLEAVTRITQLIPG